MEVVGAFIAGFGAGWVVRSTVDSGRKLAVTVIAAAHEIADRTQRWVAIEREYFEDLLAEGRAVYEQRKAQQRARATASTAPNANGASPRVHREPPANAAAASSRQERAA